MFNMLDSDRTNKLKPMIYADMPGSMIADLSAVPQLLIDSTLTYWTD